MQDTATRTSADRPSVVIVTPVYNEQAGLERYRQAVCDALMSDDSVDYRVLFVDDGSTDDSWQMIEAICGDDQRFTGIRLSRNFGSHTALTAGIEEANGDAVATLAADLQDPPEVVAQFVERWRNGAQVVWGKRKARQDAAWRVTTSNMFFAMLRKHAMPAGSKFTTGSFLLIDRAVAEAYRRFEDHNRITFALVAWTGFDQDVVEYDREQRQTGSSAWTFTKMISAMWDAFVGYSALPFKVITWAGVTLFTLAMLFALYLLVQWAIGDPQAGWTSTLFVISVLFAAQYLMMGVIGQYLSRIYTESVRRPLYFVSRRVGRAKREA